MAGTVIGGVMYFSQTAKAQDTRLQTMTTENRMLYNTKEELAQQVTSANNEFAAQALLESDLKRVDNLIRQNTIKRKNLYNEIKEKMNNETWMTAERASLVYSDASPFELADIYKNKVEPLMRAVEEHNGLVPLIESLNNELETVITKNQRSNAYRMRNLIL